MSKLQKIIFIFLLSINLGFTLSVHAIIIDVGEGERRDYEADRRQAEQQAKEKAAADARYNAKVEAAAEAQRTADEQANARARELEAEAQGVAAAEAAANRPAASNTSSTVPSLDKRDIPEGYAEGAKTGIPGILPRCAFYASGCDSGADADINIFVKLGLNVAKIIFSVIGTVAFVMFVYGGFTMILSFGSAEKFDKGKNILVAAVVGMMISFGAYLIVKFVLDVFQVSQDFRIIK